MDNHSDTDDISVSFCSNVKTSTKFGKETESNDSAYEHQETFPISGKVKKYNLRLLTIILRSWLSWMIHHEFSLLKMDSKDNKTELG